MSKPIKLTEKQKQAIVSIRTHAYATNSITHGIMGYNSVAVELGVLKSLITKGIIEWAGKSMNGKADFYELSDLGKTITL